MRPNLDTFIKALITGFGYKLGAEVGRWVLTRMGILDKDKAKAEEAEEDLPEGIPVRPPGTEDDAA